MPGKGILQKYASNRMKQRVVFLVGPTAIGKSDIAVILAKKINAEIISCDSMQIYKGMGIVTSAPGGALRKKVPHHLIDLIPSSREYNVSGYRKDALFIMRDIIRRGKTPLFVGGTGLYMSILIEGIFQQDVHDELMRQKLYALARKKGSVYLHKELEKVDSVAAAKIHPNDTRRIVRALEVFKVTGKPISALQKERHGLRDDYRLKVICLNMLRDKLYKKIEARVDQMFSSGLVKEVKKLLVKPLSKTASCAIGIKELNGYFEGAYGIDEAKELMKTNTRHYAKAQLTWFRKDKQTKWVNINEKQSRAEIVKKILNKIR